MRRDRKLSVKTHRLVLVGPGRWGMALVSTFSDSFKDVRYLGKSSTSSDWKEAFSEPCICLIATPFSLVRKTIEKLRKYKPAGVINSSKGIDRKTLATFTKIASKRLKVPCATLSGPTFAKELKAKRPSACVLAGKNKKFVKNLSKLISRPYFRVYTNDDPIGVDACGALKNVFAIACGLCDGLKLGPNTRAALLARALVEMGMMVELLGGHSTTAFGLAGVGDLWLSATCDLSRNRQLGLRLAKGQNIKSAIDKIKATKGPAEGFYTINQVQKIAKKKKVDLPICEQMYKICRGTQSPRKAITALMTRELKAEKVL